MFKKGQKVVKIIAGAGVETASVKTVCKVDKRLGLAYCDPDDLTKDGQNTYRLDSGRAVVNWVPGFTHRIVTLEE
jgi:hypothetical protein